MKQIKINIKLPTTLLLLGLLTANILSAQIKFFDKTFGINGIVKPSLTTSSYSDNLSSSLLQSDGKILLSGTSYNGVTRDFAIYRCTSNGVPDSSFGGDGKITTDFKNTNDNSVAMALQADGKILLAGFTAINANDMAIARYLQNGLLDSTFSLDGITTISVGSGTDQAFAIAIQTDGQILVAGGGHIDSAHVIEYTIIRLNKDGSSDLTCNGHTKMGTTDAWATSMSIQTDGKILLCGNSRNNLTDNITILRYLQNGLLDNSFNDSGKVVLKLSQGTSKTATSIGIQSDGKIVVTGNLTVHGLTLVRYLQNGRIDTSFGVNGFYINPVETNKEIVTKLMVLPNDQILIVGTKVGNLDSFLLRRFNSNGKLDTTFANRGKFTMSLGSENSDGEDLIALPDGKIIIAGMVKFGSVWRFGAMRFMPSTSSTNMGKLTDNSHRIRIYPNPVEDQSTLTFKLNQTELLSILLYDMQGRLTKTFYMNTMYTVGLNSIVLDFTDVMNSGIYSLVITGQDTNSIVKIIR